MTNPVAAYLSSPTGGKSSNRLMCFLSLCAAIFFGFIVVSSTVASGNISTSGENIVMWFLIAAFGGSLGNKAIETKASTSQEDKKNDA